MDSAGQSQITLVTQPYPTVPQGGELWGSKVRRSTGIIQIVCGGIAFMLGIAAICVPTEYFHDPMDYGSWGMWDGVVAVVAGSLGVYNQTKRGTVVVYMITSIIAAVMGVGCFVYAVSGSVIASYSYYASHRTGNLAIYITMCIVFFIQMVVSIVGASSTCRVFCSTDNNPQQMVYFSPPQPQQYAQAPPNTLEPAQQVNSPEKPQFSQSASQCETSFGANEPAKN